MAIINAPTPDIGNSKNVNEKIDILLNSYYLLRKEIEYALQNVDFSNLSTDLSDRLKKINEELNANATNLNNAITAIGDLETAIADGVITTYYQAEEPTDCKTGDLWFNTSTEKLYRYNGIAFDLIEDKGIVEAVQAAQNAQDTADGKIKSFYQADEPATGMSVGDLWIDTNNNNKLYRYNGTLWQAANDGRIDSIIDVNGKVIAEKILGTINTAIAKVQNSNGTVTFNDRGLIVHNAVLEINSNKALLISSTGILIANSKDVNGNWVWRTAITGDSISADQITTGTLTAINIQGVTITGSSITSGDANSEIKLNNGILSVKKKSTSQQFNINYRAGLPNKILQSELEYYNEFKASNPSKPAENTISLNSTNSHMGLEFGNGAVSMGNNWVNFAMYGGTFDWSKDFGSWVSDPTKYNPPPANAVGSKLIIDCATTVWDASKQYPGLFVAFSSTIEVNAGNVEFAGNVDVGRNFNVSGTKNCRIKTEQFGNLDFSAYETAEIYLGDIGENEVINGECIVNLDEKLLACVNIDLPYQVFITKYGQGDIWVEQRNKSCFIVKGDNIRFGWEVKAKRKDYENIRFGKYN